MNNNDLEPLPSFSTLPDDKTRGQWPYRLASYDDELMISESKLGVKFEIRSIFSLIFMRMLPIRGHVHMTSSKFLGFWTPSHLVNTKFTQLSFLSSEFG